MKNCISSMKDYISIKGYGMVYIKDHSHANLILLLDIQITSYFSLMHKKDIRNIWFCKMPLLSICLRVCKASQVFFIVSHMNFTCTILHLVEKICGGKLNLKDGIVHTLKILCIVRFSSFITSSQTKKKKSVGVMYDVPFWCSESIIIVMTKLKICNASRRPSS